MASVLVRNLPDEVHRALRVRAAQHNHSTEAEIRDILAAVALPPERVKLGSLLASISREIGLTDEECAVFDTVRDKTASEPLKFE
ncbi:MAG: plasmid stabilization protein [Desulfobulbus sp.]|nr:plasmid stabilization protein [Desulfobulbus sp.]